MRTPVRLAPGRHPRVALASPPTRTVRPSTVAWPEPEGIIHPLREPREEWRGAAFAQERRLSGVMTVPNHLAFHHEDHVFRDVRGEVGNTLEVTRRRQGVRRPLDRVGIGLHDLLER